MAMTKKIKPAQIQRGSLIVSSCCNQVVGPRDRAPTDPFAHLTMRGKKRPVNADRALVKANGLLLVVVEMG
jgi:hypothetical protein